MKLERPGEFEIACHSPVAKLLSMTRDAASTRVLEYYSSRKLLVSASHMLYDRQRQTLVTTRCPADQRIGHTFRHNGRR